jgi:putative acetyltransferase
MVDIRPSRPGDGHRALEIWRDAVDATHDFLSPRDRRMIGHEVAIFLPRAPLWIAADPAGRPIGFMLLSDTHMEALFVDPAHHGEGVGRALVEHALALHPALTADVNEQNGRAVGFYERLGFVRIGRSDFDGEKRPYPLIHLRHGG